VNSEEEEGLPGPKCGRAMACSKGRNNGSKGGAQGPDGSHMDFSSLWPISWIASLLVDQASYVLAHPSLMLLSVIIALLAHVIVQQRRHREELSLLGRQVRQLDEDSELVVQLLQICEERIERLRGDADKVEDVVVEVLGCVRETLGDKVKGAETEAAGSN
jgi:hypothetical protein